MGDDCLQCFDVVCWVSGGILTCKHVLAWYLSGVKCKWFTYGPAHATANPQSLALVKSAFLVPAYPGCPGKRPLNGCSNSNNDNRNDKTCNKVLCSAERRDRTFKVVLIAN